VPRALGGGGDWPATQSLDTLNHDEPGNLGLGPADEAAPVRFVKTLIEGYTPKPSCRLSGHCRQRSPQENPRPGAAAPILAPGGDSSTSAETCLEESDASFRRQPDCGCGNPAGNSLYAARTRCGTSPTSLNDNPVRQP
jgi:hypothetical protein